MVWGGRCNPKPFNNHFTARKYSTAEENWDFIAGFISALNIPDGTFFAHQVDKSWVKVEASEQVSWGPGGDNLLWCGEQS